MSGVLREDLAAEEAAGDGANQDTILHAAIRRLSEEFLGTAAGPAPRSIALFGICGFPETDEKGPRRETFERIRAAIGVDLSRILEARLAEADLAVRLTDVTDGYRELGYASADRNARDAYTALADAFDGSVYYNRDPRAGRFRRLTRPDAGEDCPDS